MSQRLFANQLPHHLKQQLAPCYLLFGDEPLQRMEALQQLQQAAQARGFAEVKRITLENAELAPLLDALQGMSLFSSQQVVVLDLGNGKLERAASEILQHYASQPSPDICLLLHGDKLETAQKNKAWFKALQKLGVEITLTQPAGNQLYRWLHERCRALGLQLEPEAQQLLVDSHEGNLLALAQELDKLQLIYQQQAISAQQVREVAVDQSRYSVFQLMDALLGGDLNNSLHMLEQLKQTEIEPLVLLWAFNRELSNLRQLTQPQARGKEASIFKTLRIWPSRQNLFRQAIARLSAEQLNTAESILAELERQLKGGSQQAAAPWPLYTSIALLFCGEPLDNRWLLAGMEGH